MTYLSRLFSPMPHFRSVNLILWEDQLFVYYI